MISTEGSKRNVIQFLKGEIHHQGSIKAIHWNQAFNLPLGIQHLLRGHSEGEQGASALEHSLQETSPTLPPPKPWRGAEYMEPHFIEVKWGKCAL